MPPKSLEDEFDSLSVGGHGQGNFSSNQWSQNSASGYSRQHNGHVFNTTNNILPTPAPPGKKHAHWLVDRTPNSSFTGQQDIGEQLDRVLLPSDDREFHPCKKFVLRGIGGVGKSEIALQFAHRNRQKYWGVFWLDCTSIDSVRASWTSITRKCGWNIDLSRDLMRQAKVFLAGCPETILLVLDNCDDPTTNYADFFPSLQRGAILMTTRLSNGGKYGNCGTRHITGLDEASATELLLKLADEGAGSRSDETSAQSIVELLEYHPLAISVAGALIEQGLYSLAEYATALQSKKEELLFEETTQDRSVYGTVYATFEVSAERLQDSANVHARNALWLLGVLAFLDRSNVSEGLFDRAWTFGVQYGEEAYDDGDISHLSHWHFLMADTIELDGQDCLAAFRRARQRLMELSLVFYDPDMSAISMHHLIHVWAKKRLNPTEQAKAWATANSILAFSMMEVNCWTIISADLQRHFEICATPPANVWAFCPPLQVLRMLNCFELQLEELNSTRVQVIVESIDDILAKAPAILPEYRHYFLYLGVRFYTDRLIWSKAVEKALELLNLTNALYKAGSVPTFWAKMPLLWVLLAARNPDPVIACCTSLLPIIKRDLGSGSASLAVTLNIQEILGKAYIAAGQHANAAEVLEKSISTAALMYATDDPQFYSMHHLLAYTCGAMGRLGDAISLMQMSVEGHRQGSDPTSLERLRSEYMLARYYLEAGRFVDATLMCEQLLDTPTGPTKPRWWRTAERTLLESYVEEGKFQQGQRLFDRIDQTTPEPGYRELLHIVQLGSAVYLGGDQREKALALAQQAFAIACRNVAPGDIGRHATECCLLARLVNAGRFTEARSFFETLSSQKMHLSAEDRAQLESLEVILDYEGWNAMVKADAGKAGLSSPLYWVRWNVRGESR